MLVVLQVLVQQCERKNCYSNAEEDNQYYCFKLRVLQLATQLTNTTYFS